jgi:hypothetical protein
VRHAAATICLALLATSSACTSKETYQQASIDAAGQLRAVTSRGRVLTVPQDSGQTGVEQVAVSPDRHTVGWIALYPNCCTTYPIPLKLVLLRPDSHRTVIGGGLPIWQWAFTSNSRQVVLRESPVHGESTVHYELRDAASGSLVTQADAGIADAPPDWARRVAGAAAATKR